jgi:hypothetical protein
MPLLIGTGRRGRQDDPQARRPGWKVKKNTPTEGEKRVLWEAVHILSDYEVVSVCDEKAVSGNKLKGAHNESL